MNRRMFVLAALVLTGCATAGPQAAKPASTPAPPQAPTRPLTSAAPVLAELEPLYAAQAGRDTITIRVSSNGCTSRGDFAFYVERRGDAVTLAFGRRRIDTCRSFAMGYTDIVFTWAELGLAPRTPVFLLNPLMDWIGS
jgi:hypothetical protein